MNKPPYSVPSMDEIAEVKGTNGYRVISTFSGCGGSCLGFEMAGFEIVSACEFVEAAAEVYELNHPGVPVDRSDLRDMPADALLALAGVGRGEIDVLEGSPPCAAFSEAGKREAGWGEVNKYSETEQRVDDLFFEFARLVDGIQPRVFVAENVAGLVKGSAKGYFKEILKALKECGYCVEAKVLDAQWLGVPQTRNRLIFVGVRNDLPVKHQWPDPLPYRYSVRDVCPHITGGIRKANFGKTSEVGITRWDAKKPSPTVTAGGLNGMQSNEFMPLARWSASKPSDAVMAQGMWGVSYDESFVYGDGKLPAGMEHEIDNGDIRRWGVGREWHRRTGGHGIPPRKYTIAELRRLCSFPDDFKLIGTFSQRWERLGRSVPPLMMRAIAEKVRGMLDQCAV